MSGSRSHLARTAFPAVLVALLTGCSGSSDTAFDPSSAAGGGGSGFGGALGSGGTSGADGVGSSGGGAGGTAGSDAGGASGTASGSGGPSGASGASGSGGLSGASGASGSGGASGASGASGTGGASGGAAGKGGASGSGGSSGGGGSSGTGGSGGSAGKPDAGLGGKAGASGGPADAGDASVRDAAVDAREASVACPPLIHHWPANGNALDVVGQNNGQLAGATFAAGASGQAFVFNGASSVTAARAPALRNTGDWSYSLWVRVASYTNGPINTSGGSYFVDRTVETSNLASLKAIGGSFAFQVRYNDGTGLGGPVGGAIAIGTWTHVAMVRRAGTQFALYVAGRLASTTPDNGRALTLPIPKFGHHALATTLGFTGAMDEVRMYDGALTLAQVQALAAGIDCR